MKIVALTTEISMSPAMKTNRLKNIQEIFLGRFSNEPSATVQICKQSSGAAAENERLLKIGESEVWPHCKTRLFVLAVQDTDLDTYNIWAGRLQAGKNGQSPVDGGYRMRVEGRRFHHLGSYTRGTTSHLDFYGKNAAASRVLVANQLDQRRKDIDEAINDVPSHLVDEVLRLVRARGSTHTWFRDQLRKRWGRKCSVHGVECNGQLIASHIVAWKDDEKARGDPNNGLLLSAPLDALFEEGLISFDTAGSMLHSKHLKKATKEIFGVRSGQKIRWDCVRASDQKEMVKYLAQHRFLHAAKHGYAD